MAAITTSKIGGPRFQGLGFDYIRGQSFNYTTLHSKSRLLGVPERNVAPRGPPGPAIVTHQGPTKIGRGFANFRAIAIKPLDMNYKNGLQAKNNPEIEKKNTKKAKK